jgi:hypothetical protein
LSKQAPHNLTRLIAGLIVLAALLACPPVHARAADAVRCGANGAGMSRAPRAQVTDSHQAGLVIDFGDGRVMTFCIDLGADGQATGEELLRASGLPVIIEYSGGIGGAVCKIDTVGSNFPSEPCFAHCTLQPGEKCMYWSYSQLVGDHWQFSQVGASGTVVHSGDVNGWAWGESTIAQGAQPPLRTLAEICLPPTATPTPSSTPTPSLTPTATQQPAGSPTQAGVPPPATTTPYVARVITATPTASPQPTSTLTASPTIAPPVPTSAPTAQPAISTPVPESPTLTPSATALPAIASTAPTSISLAMAPSPARANRSVGGNLRVRLPLIQHASAATPRPKADLATPLRAAPAPVPTTPPPQLAPADDPASTYPYFGAMSAFLLAGWALLRRGRGRRPR